VPLWKPSPSKLIANATFYGPTTAVARIQTRLEVDEFLKEHGVELEYTLEDLARDREAHRKLGL
jgi:hypothetical protein